MTNEYGFDVSDDCPECEVCGDVMSERITKCDVCKKPVCARHLKEGMCDICRHKEELKAQRKAETLHKIQNYTQYQKAGATKL